MDLMLERLFTFIDFAKFSIIHVAIA